MKHLFTFLTLLLAGSLTLSAQSKVWTAVVDFNGNVDDVTQLAQIDAAIPGDGMALVTFDGTCISSVGDHIILAASNDGDWHINSGAVDVEANPNQEEHSFSHSRFYPVSAGTHSFYAVAQAYIETAGDGNAQIVGLLTVKFFPSGSDMIFAGTEIEQEGVNLRGAPVTLAQLTINPGMSGTAIVHFDGVCFSTPGDLIVLAASDTPSWNFFDDNVPVEAIDNDYNAWSFSHTRAYDIGAGTHTFYAVGQNFAMMDGDGIAYIYGTLTVEFIPDMYAPDVIPAFTGIINSADPSVNTEIASVSITAAEAGTTVVTFDGNAEPDDFLLLGASNQTYLQSFGVGVSPYDELINFMPFSHSQAYAVSAGMHSFYATGATTFGSSTATCNVYGSLKATYVSDDVSVSTKEVQRLAQSVEVFPNPTADLARVHLGEVKGIQYIQLLNSEGKVLQRFEPQTAEQSGYLDVNLQARPAGTYYLQIVTNDRMSISKKITRQ